MATRPTASDVLDREFLTIRARLVDLAAALDRVDRADGSVSGDPRVKQIRRSFEVLSDSAPDRAERVQRLFSLPYEPQWRKE
jgi:hypothetical protein